jgi:recombinational DNA repair protein (RecF pathway)
MHILDDGYVLNKRPFKNTSAIVHYFTREHGIICLVAKGAKKVTKGLCVNLEQFILQKIYFIPKASLGILVRQELFIKEKYIDSSLLFITRLTFLMK